MAATYDSLVDKLAATCVSIHNDTLRPPHNNDGKSNEALILQHDALLALRISTIPTERQRAICLAANLKFDHNGAAPTHQDPDTDKNSSTLPVYPATNTPRAEREAREDQDLVLRLAELRPKEVAQAVVDVVGRISGGLLEQSRIHRRDRYEEVEIEGEAEHKWEAEYEGEQEVREEEVSKKEKK